MGNASSRPACEIMRLSGKKIGERHLSEVSQVQKDKGCMPFLIFGR
jgi:hypothetical protein